jgi:hypothetical protein
VVIAWWLGVELNWIILLIFVATASTKKCSAFYVPWLRRPAAALAAEMLLRASGPEGHEGCSPRC